MTAINVARRVGVQAGPVAVMAADAPARAKPSNYPEPFAARMAGRLKRPLGDLFGLANFGVNLTTLAPGAVSALRHAHSRQDEFVYIVEGHPTLQTDAGRTVLSPGMCAGFEAGTGDAHCLVNESTEAVVYLEVGDRTEGDEGSYPDDDLKAVRVGNAWQFVHRDGSPYEAARPPGVTVAERFDEMAAPPTASYAALERQLEERTRELTDALDRQAATAEVLQAIGSSVADTRPVFDKILQSCTHLFDSSEQGILVFGADGKLHLGAHHGVVSSRLAALFPVADAGALGPSIREDRVLQYKDVLNDAGVPTAIRAIAEQLRIGTYSQVFAPMKWQGRNVGSLYVTRQPAVGFTDTEIALLKTFADQAAIAIENARLFNETREALEQQTATAEVLGVISSSVADTQPVFDKILDSCERLFAASGLGIYLVDDAGMLRSGGFRGKTFETVGLVRAVAGIFPRPLAGTATELAIRQRRVVHYPEVLSAADVPLPLRRIAEQVGDFSIAFAPMLWEGRGVGAIQVSRDPPNPFSDKELALLKTFADQAVIAIQNARLFNETREALEQQKASSEVLNVISSSVADTRPVFDSILRSCERLFGGSHAVIDRLGDDRAWHLAAYAGPKRDELAALYPVSIGDAPDVDAEILQRRITHYPDVNAPEVPENLRYACGMVGCTALVMAPMLSESRRIGTILVGRNSGVPFSPAETALLQTFADQAVIAIRNAALFGEIEAKSRELEQANRHKSEFLANMSHELRTPLNAIIGFSEVLSEKMFGEVNDKQLEYLQDIHTSGHHLLSLINDILDLSKIEAGRMELDLERFDLGLLLDNSMNLVRERAAGHGLGLVFENDGELGDWVADPRKIKQVVINLLSNAVKFTPPGGTVTLRARRIDDGAAVEIAVTDTGIGIAPDQQALVFEEFRQASGDYLRKTEGTGLGLALARRFVELHGGSIRVESAPGRGSTFAFILPQARVHH